MHKYLVALFIITAACGYSPAVAKKTVAQKPLTESQAVALVAQRAEVKAWKKAVDAAAKSRGVSAHIDFDRKENGEFVIHAYELVPDDAESSHTATFNWYHVNQRSRKVTKEF